mgnify:CR=1 FL=1
MLVTKGQLINIIKASLHEDIAYSSPAYGNIVVDDPGTNSIPALSDLNILYQRSLDAGDMESAKLIKLLNSELFKSISANDKSVWERIGEFMLSSIGFIQQVDIKGGPKVATFYDVVKDGKYYSVKTSFDKPAGARAGARKAFGASALKLSQIDYIMLPEHNNKLWGCIGCVKQVSQQYPGAMEIFWGITPTRAGADFEIDESVDMRTSGGVQFIKPNVFVGFQGDWKGRQTRMRAASAEALFGQLSPLWTIKLMPAEPVDPEIESVRGRLMRLAGTADSDLLTQIISLLDANGIVI